MMNMIEVKTLKDIEGEVGFECSCGKKWKSKDNAIFPKTLKQEAVKWVNEIRINYHKEFYCDCDTTISFIKHFFNLTGEDLRC